MATAHQDLDETQLAELREDLGDAFIGFAERFLLSARNVAAELESDLAAGALSQAASRAHQLKGTAGYLGAAKFADTLGQVQRAAEAESSDEVRALVHVLQGDLASLAPRLVACLGQG